MENGRFDSLTRALAQRPTRRVVTRVFGSLTLGGVFAPLLGHAETTAKHKKKHKKKRGGSVPPPPESPPPVPPPPPPPNICQQNCLGANCAKCLIRVNNQPPVCVADLAIPNCQFCSVDSDCNFGPHVCISGVMDRATGTVSNPCAQSGAPTFCAQWDPCG